jgi:hypothetical protein
MGNYWWAGNWWAGAAPAAPGTGVALDERIMAQIKTVLEGVTVANGYHQDVTVVRPPEAPQSFGADDCPLYIIRRDVEQGRSHIRRAYEFILTVTIECVSANSGDTPEEDHANLRADLKHIVYQNRRWHDGSENLAQRTWILDTGVHETEVTERTVTSQVVFQVLARADREDFTEPKVV